MSEDSDQTLLFGEAILNDLVADEKCLHGRFVDISHEPIVEKCGGEGKTVFDCLRQRDGQQEILKEG